MIKEASHLHCHANYSHNMHRLAQKPCHWWLGGVGGVGWTCSVQTSFTVKVKKMDKEYDFKDNHREESLCINR